MIMKRQNKKRGFTIVELVIVIAVIAIMSAVLIPTFSGIIKKSQMSSDQKVVRAMNMAIAGEEIADYNALSDSLNEDGFNIKVDMVSHYKGYSYYWYQPKNTIVLVGSNNQIAYPSDLKWKAEFESKFSTDVDTAEAAGIFALKASNYVVSSNAATASAAAKEIKNILNNGNSVKLTKKYAEPIEMAVSLVKEGDSIVVDLGGNTIKTTDRGDGNAAYGFNVYGELALDNAVIDARGVEVRSGGKMTLGNGVKVTANGARGGAAIYVYAGGEAIINGGEYANSVAQNDLNGSGTAVISLGKITINGGTFTAVGGVYPISIEGGEAVINNATVKGHRGGIAVSNAKATINNCTATSDSWIDGSAYPVYVGGNSTVTIIGGTFVNNHGGKSLFVESGSTVKLEGNPALPNGRN